MDEQDDNGEVGSATSLYAAMAERGLTQADVLSALRMLPVAVRDNLSEGGPST